MLNSHILKMNTKAVFCPFLVLNPMKAVTNIFQGFLLLCNISKIFITFCTDCISCKMLPAQSKVRVKSGLSTATEEEV